VSVYGVGVLLPVILDDLRANLVTRLAAIATPYEAEPCESVIYSGPQAVADWCRCSRSGGGCGQAWTRLFGMVASTTAFPIPDQRANACDAVVAAVIELGVLRCAPGPDNRGQVDPAAVTNSALQAALDAAAMREAIACAPTLDTKDRASLLGRYDPIGSGDCVGGTWQVTVQLVGPLPPVDVTV
jgi:hypothetical protein